MKKTLSGKKTYFTAAAAVLTSFGAYFAGEVDLTVTIQAVFAAMMVVFLRKGVTSEAAKAANGEEVPVAPPTPVDPNKPNG
jgi:hypothetical protein